MDKCSFVVAMLVQSGKVDKEADVDHWLKKFDELDADGSGVLDQDDIALMEQQEKERVADVESVVRQSSTASSVGIFVPAGISNSLGTEVSEEHGVMRTPLLKEEEMP